MNKKDVNMEESIVNGVVNCTGRDNIDATNDCYVTILGEEFPLQEIKDFTATQPQDISVPIDLYINGMSIDEIATILRLPQSSLMNRIRYALAKLQNAGQQ